MQILKLSQPISRRGLLFAKNNGESEKRGISLNIFFTKKFQGVLLGYCAHIESNLSQNLKITVLLKRYLVKF